ncbi:MAG: response regulator [Planctomycetes bacterium]|nr:response regulator [Planctomycetota bacterium]
MKTILAVDDDPAILKVIRVHLEKAGYRVLAETSAAGAIERLDAEPVDLAVLDIMMPGTDGLELCERMRATGRRMPILFLTARGSSIDVLQGYAAGAQAYLTKPFKAKELLEKVEYAFRAEPGL